MENSILKIFGSVDVKITPDFCSWTLVLSYVRPEWLNRAIYHPYIWRTFHSLIWCTSTIASQKVFIFEVVNSTDIRLFPNLCTTINVFSITICLGMKVQSRTSMYLRTYWKAWACEWWLLWAFFLANWELENNSPATKVSWDVPLPHSFTIQGPSWKTGFFELGLRVKICKLDFVRRWFWNPEIWEILLLKPVF